MDSDPLQLERHTAFAARLASSLVADENAAADLVQETWLAVLRRPPRDRAAVRSYLATTLRRFAGKAKRSAARRAARERDFARDEALPSSAELALAMEQHQRVVAALMELKEQTRTSILLRYLEDVPPRDIAARSGEPVETVRTRIKRGLATLRARLDEREGGRGAWALALAPLSGAEPWAVAPPSAALASGAAHTTGMLLMTLKLKLAIAAVLTLIAAVAWRSLGPREDIAREPGVALSSSRTVASPAAFADARPMQIERAEETGSRAAVASEALAAPEIAAVIGTIRVVDAGGVEHTGENGRFTIEAGDERVDVEVAAGRFTFERPATNVVRVGAAELRGRPAFFTTSEIVLPERSSEEPFELVATWTSPSILRVVDARTGAELDGLTVLRGISRTRDAVHPGWTGDPSAVFARDARSPLTLSAFGAIEGWWVHAPGYSWGWARVDHRTGGEREVALEPGGADLAVRLDGFDPALNLWLHVFPAGWERSFGGLLFVRHPEQSEVVFEGLPPGAVQVRAELGIWYAGPHELAREELELLPGVRSEVVLDLEQAGALPAVVPLAGRVVLPASAPDLDVSFEIMPAEGAARRTNDRVYRGRVQLEAEPGQPRVRRFDAGRVTPGRYLFVSNSLQYWEAFDVGPGGARDVEITLPETGEVRVRIVDAATGEPLAVERIAWSAVGRPPGHETWTLASVHADPETKEYIFTAPLGRIQLSVGWDEYSRGSRGIDVTPGSKTHELRMRRLPGAWVRLADGAATVPFEWGWNVDVTHADGSTKSKARITRIEGGRAWVVARAPGTYVLELPLLAGFRPVVPRTLELGPNGGEELVIELERR